MITDEQRRRELEFHLREIAADVGSALDSLRLAGSEPDAAAARTHLLNARASVEHDLEHHLPEAETLLRGIVGGDLPEAPSAVEGPGADLDPRVVLERAMGRLEGFQVGLLDGGGASADVLPTIRSCLAAAQQEIEKKYLVARRASERQE